jgi:hypothetical protein
MGTAALPVGADAAFDAVFGLFVAAFIVLVVVTMRWAVRRDRGGREEWLARRQARSGYSRDTEPPASNGRGSMGSSGRSSGAPG